MDGASTIRALRKINPAAKIIAASGLDANAGAIRVSDIGHFLAKPYTAETLRRSLQSILHET